VVTHHALAAPLIANFFAAAGTSEAESGPYDTVIIVAPNHEGDIADVVMSRLDGKRLYLH
ncbi:MAG: hypothetical protein LBS62_06740, partial [Clostridiales bacterium]|jgi:hypothetical protein|nr:hypothetical protein [Clostridiales bacterium]